MIENERERAIMRRTMLEPSPLQPYMPGELRIERRECFALAGLGGEGYEENYALVFGPVDPDRMFELAREFFQSDDYSIVVESDVAPEIDDLLLGQNWPIDEDVPSMLLDPIPVPPERITGIDIREVRDEQTFEDFMRISATGRRWVPSLEAATDPNVALLVGYLDETPVATSRVNCLPGLGEINGVVTDPRFRRRGIGTDMTWAAIAAAVARDCQAIVLTATEMGFPVYERMGFRTICSYRTYVRPGTG